MAEQEHHQSTAGIGLTFSLTGEGRIVARCAQLTGRQPVTLDWVQQALAGMGWSDVQLDPEQSEHLVNVYNLVLQTIELDIGSARPSLSPAQRVQIECTPDGLQAFLTLLDAPDDAPFPGVDDLQQALRQAGVVHGIDLSALEQIAREGIAKRCLVARATLPQVGADGTLHSLIGDIVERGRKRNAHGVVDFRDMGHVVVVHEGDQLIRRLPPGPGVSGRRVDGVAIPAQPGKMAVYPARLLGVAPDPANPDLLLATQAGQPHQTADLLEVEQILTVKQVDLSTGNIDFVGTVTVQGDVCTGMQVKASGDVVVGGMLEAASIEAGGVVRIKGGVKGQGDTRVRAGGSIEVLFAEGAELKAGADILVHGYALKCVMHAGQQIRVGNPGGKGGKLMGGQAHATYLVHTRCLGADSGLSTQVQVGVDPEKAVALTAARVERDRKASFLEDLAKTERFLTEHPERQTAELNDRLAHSLDQAREELQAAEAALQRVQEDIDYMQHARVVAELVIYPGVQVVVGSQVYHITAERKGPVSVAIDDSTGQLAFSSQV